MFNFNPFSVSPTLSLTSSLSVSWSSCVLQDKRTSRRPSRSFQPNCHWSLYHLLVNCTWSEKTPLRPYFLSLHIFIVTCVCVSVCQSFSLRPLQVVLPSREDQDSPVIDIDLHLPFLCFTHTTLLQVIHKSTEQQETRVKYELMK